MNVDSIQPPVEHKGLRWYLQFGIKYGPPSLNDGFVQMLIALQIFGPCTYEDIVSYTNFRTSNRRLAESYYLRSKYSWTRYLLYYNLIKTVKRYKKGGRIFELGENGEALLDWILSRS